MVPYITKAKQMSLKTIVTNPLLLVKRVIYLSLFSSSRTEKAKERATHDYL